MAAFPGDARADRQNRVAMRKGVAYLFPYREVSLLRYKLIEQALGHVGHQS